jgi:hypothetical protein
MGKIARGISALRQMPHGVSKKLIDTNHLTRRASVLLIDLSSLTPRRFRSDASLRDKAILSGFTVSAAMAGKSPSMASSAIES